MTGFRLPTLKIEGSPRMPGLGTLTTGATTYKHLTIRVTDADFAFLEKVRAKGDSVNRLLYLIVEDWMRRVHDRQLQHVPKQIAPKGK